MIQKEYDVVIVGSGVAGAIIAKTLTRACKKVLLLEAGLEEGLALEGQRAFETNQKYLQTFYKALAKTPNSPYPEIKNAPSPDVLDVTNLEEKTNRVHDGYYVQKGPLAFGSDNLVAGGGTTMHWLGTSLRMLPNDFEMHKKYSDVKMEKKEGWKWVDWPITYEELVPYYEMAEFELGVSGDVKKHLLPDGIENFFRDGYVFPMENIPQSYLDKKFMESTNPKVIISGSEYNLKYSVTPQGRNSMPNADYKIRGIRWNEFDQKLEVAERDKNGFEPVPSIWDRYTGQRCEGNASCVPICPVQAKYNALKTLKSANRDNLVMLTQAVASELIINERTKEIDGIIYKKYETANSLGYTTHIAKGRIYVLAASAIENAKLLLVSNAANSSDQVGRNLMDHLCLLTWGLFPEKVYPFRGPGSTTNICTFRDGDFRKEHAACIVPLDNWGWGWPEFSPGTDVSIAVNKGIFGKELRELLNHDLTRQVLLHFECEQNPHPDNRVTIDPQYKDQLDNCRPVIHYNASDYMKRAFEASKKVSDQIFSAKGIIDRTKYKKEEADNVAFNGERYTFRGAGHIVGTHRMGSDKKDSVVDKELRTWDHTNLFLAGSGNMPTLGTSNPTLTLAALSFKASEAILKQLK
ncbi:MAG: GMC family oxidoreductase [Ferruginibacter sp.]